jgi:uncharacterized protein
MDPHQFILIAIGFVIGIFSGLISIGGGLILIPTMLHLFPEWTGISYPLKIITGLAVTQGVAGSFSSTLIHAKKQGMAVRPILMLGLGALIGSYFGGFTSQFYEDVVIKALLVVILIAMMILSVYSPRAAEESLPDASSDTNSETREPDIRLTPKFFLITLVVGYVSGILGIGGAAFIVPLMYSLMAIPVRRAIAMGAGIVLLTSLASFVGKWQAGQILWLQGGLISIGAICGGFLGAKISSRLPLWVLKSLFFLLTGFSLIRTLIGILEHQAF